MVVYICFVLYMLYNHVMSAVYMLSNVFSWFYLHAWKHSCTGQGSDNPFTLHNTQVEKNEKRNQHAS